MMSSCEWPRHAWLKQWELIYEIPIRITTLSKTYYLPISRYGLLNWTWLVKATLSYMIQDPFLKIWGMSSLAIQGSRRVSRITVIPWHRIDSHIGQLLEDSQYTSQEAGSCIWHKEVCMKDSTTWKWQQSSNRQHKTFRIFWDYSLVTVSIPKKYWF